jgi:putative DNA primase/helicase
MQASRPTRRKQRENLKSETARAGPKKKPGARSSVHRARESYAMADIIEIDSHDNSENVDRATEIERLAALDAIDYEAVRTTAASRLGFRSSVLDSEVKKKRRELGLERAEDDGQGRAVKIEDILPWPDAIEGDHVATALAASLKRYVVLSDAAADAIALWILHTWLVDKFTITPRLAITSPTKGCGKTTVLRFLNQVVYRPKRAGSISPPALFRAVEQFYPTVIVDETEKYIEHGSDLHALLNEGHCKGGTVLRVLGDKLELREFSVFAAVAFAANGRLADDLEQRSIVIEMQRRRADEDVAELREDRCGQLQNLARMCARWADEVAGTIRDHDPDMGGLINRVADNWRPLFAIADAIGSDWPGRAREAAFALGPRENESIGPMLLDDIKRTFDDRAMDRLSSADVCEALNAMEGKPWGDWKGKSLTPNQLARLLKPFGIVTNTTIRVGSKTAKGYHRHQFEELWERYLAAQGVYERSQGNNADEMDTSCAFQKVTEKADVTFQKCEKPPSNGLCYRVTDQNGDRAASHESDVCCHCGKASGAILPFAYGDRQAELHLGCREAWIAAGDDDLTIPSYLDRRAVG